MTRDEMFMEVCRVVAQRSKDPSTKIGAVVSDGHALVAVGYNGPPRSVDDAKVPWTRPEKYGWVIHAEHNAVLFALAARKDYMLKGCTLYCSGLTCSRCMLLAAQVGVSRVVCGPVVPFVCDSSDWMLSVEIANASRMEVVRV